jgi:hypothetical protein
LTFAIVTRDEIWASGSLLERRLSHGIAEPRGADIHATDACDPALLAAVDAEMTRARAALVPGPRVRVVVTARRIGNWTGVSSSMGINYKSLSLLTTPEFAANDQSRILLAAARGEGARRPDEGTREIPLVWRNGSAAVLLHEAAGHAAEHGYFTHWPQWLSVRDEPSDPVDDTGAAAAGADLFTEPPRCRRRQTFTDVPLPRMTNVVVRQLGAPFEMPARRIEIDLLAGGRYEPLDQTVTLHVTAAQLIDGSSSAPLEPFVITESAETIARSLRGARGDPERYPGVVCSREGQEVVVGSHAPLLVTLFE